MPSHPNILLVLTDQHRLSAVGAYGDTPCRTPNIDRLAAEGIRFENTYTTNPVCSPARGSIITGLYPHAHGITSNCHNLGCSVHEIADRPSLLQRRLGASGYSNGYTGKWHLGSDAASTYGGPNTPSVPTSIGFEGQDFPGHGGGGFNYPEYRAYLDANGYTHDVTWPETTERHLPMGQLAGPPESTVPWFLADHTISLVDRFAERDAPFFIWHNFWGPHGPYFAPKEYVDRYRDVDIPPWPNFEWPSRGIAGPHHVKIHPEWERLAWDDWANAVRYYYAFTSLIDDQIGRMVAHLEATGALDSTIIIFAADHGETIGSHGGLYDKGWHHFEEIQRIPCIVRLPDGAHAGEVRDAFVSLADVHPTILDYAGADFDPGALHGRSLRPLIEDPAVDWRDDIVIEFGGVNNIATTMRTLRHGNLKYGWNPAHADELYDLAADPHETRNIIAHPAYADALSDLRSRLFEWMKQTGDAARGIFSNQHRQFTGV